MRILSRAEWGATVSPGHARRNAISEAWLHHSVTIADENYSFEDVNDVIKDMKEIERIGKTRFGCFPYSFCIHPSGVIAEGAGWDHLGAHTAGHNSVGVGICFIGNYQVDALPVGARDACIDLINHGIAIGKLPRGVPLPTGGHRDTKATACPGDNVQNEIPFIRSMSGGEVPEITPEPTPRPPETNMTQVVTDLPVLSKNTRSTLPYDTRALQFMLNDKCSQALVVDGDFYTATESAVRNFQAFFKLSVDGIAGKDTWGLLLMLP